jgi:hypothetical protein
MDIMVVIGAMIVLGIAIASVGVILIGPTGASGTA